MENILYITYVDYLENAFPGVQAKIASQIGALREAGYHVDLISQYGGAARLAGHGDQDHELFTFPLFRRFSILEATKAALSRRSYTGAYIRFQFFSEDVRRITALLKKHGAKVILEIPTFPYEQELHQQGLKGEIKLFCDRLFRKSCLKHIDRISYPIKYDTILGLPCISIRNGLDYASFPLRSVRQPEEDALHLLVVASMQPWQGYDRLLQGLAAYNSAPHQTRIVVHMIGDGTELPGYKKFASANGLDGSVIFYGRLDRDSIRSIADGCDLAVGSLGTFRRGGVTCLGTLKSREYCALGLPSVNATPTDILDPSDPFCLYIPEGGAPVDMEQIVEFYRDVYFRSGMTALEIAQSIRRKAMALSDSHVVFQPVIDYFSEK